MGLRLFFAHFQNNRIITRSVGEHNKAMWLSLITSKLITPTELPPIKFYQILLWGSFGSDELRRIVVRIWKHAEVHFRTMKVDQRLLQSLILVFGRNNPTCTFYDQGRRCRCKYRFNGLGRRTRTRKYFYVSSPSRDNNAKKDSLYGQRESFW